MNERDERDRFRTLLEPELPRLYRLACRLTASRVDAEDLFQDVLARAWPRLDELAALDAPGPWLARVMYNRYVDERRRHARRRLSIVDEAALPSQSIESLSSSGRDLDDYVRREQLSQLERALAALAESQRVVVLLHDVEGYTLNEVRQITGDALGTLKSRLHRARQRLRELLPDFAGDGTFS